MRSHGDRSLLSRHPEQLVRRLGTLGVLVGDVWRFGRVCSHGLTIWFRWPKKIGRRSYFRRGGRRYTRMR